jgi:hypothetical protein
MMKEIHTMPPLRSEFVLLVILVILQVTVLILVILQLSTKDPVAKDSVAKDSILTEKLAIEVKSMRYTVKSGETFQNMDTYVNLEMEKHKEALRKLKKIGATVSIATDPDITNNSNRRDFQWDDIKEKFMWLGKPQESEAVLSDSDVILLFYLTIFYDLPFTTDN